MDKSDGAMCAHDLHKSHNRLVFWLLFDDNDDAHNRHEIEMGDKLHFSCEIIAISRVRLKFSQFTTALSSLKLTRMSLYLSSITNISI